MSDKTAISDRAIAKLTAGAPISPIVPSNIDEVFRLAELIHQSGLAPYQLKNAQAVTVVFLKGLEIGLPPMAALETIGVINGKACLYGDGIPALLWGRGFKIKEWYEGDGDGLTAKCVITRPDGTEYAGEFSVRDAKDARLWDEREKVKRKIDGEWKDVPNDAPWHRYRKRMLKMRARIWTGRDAASDVLKGIPIFEEQADIELDRDQYREVGNAALPVPDDIPDETPATQQLSEAEDTQDPPITDQEGYLASLEENLAAADSEETLGEVWTGHESLAHRLSDEARARAEAMHAVHEKRLQPKEPKGKKK